MPGSASTGKRDQTLGLQELVELLGSSDCWDHWVLWIVGTTGNEITCVAGVTMVQNLYQQNSLVRCDCWTVFDARNIGTSKKFGTLGAVTMVGEDCLTQWDFRTLRTLGIVGATGSTGLH